MNIVLINTFLAVERAGSLVKASQTLNITQSTVTTRLQALEQDLGQTLLRRQKSGVVLSAAGLKFKRYAEAITNMWQQAQQDVSLPENMNAVCNLACETDLWPTLGKPLVSHIRTHHPHTALSMRHGTDEQIDEWLSIGFVDAALSYRASTVDGASGIELGVEELLLYSTSRDSGMRDDPDYVYIDAGPEFGRAHTTAYADAGIANHSFDSAAWGLEHILEHAGSAYLPETMVQPYVEDGKLFRVNDAPAFSRQRYLLVSSNLHASCPWLPELAKAVAVAQY